MLKKPMEGLSSEATGMLKSVLLIVYIFIIVAILLFFVMALLKWREKQKERKKKVQAQLISRCYRILSILDVLSDRYLPHPTKLLLVEYLLVIIPNLASEKEAEELGHKLPALTEMHKELKSAAPMVDKNRVDSSEYLAKVQTALQSLPPLLKGFALTGITDHQTAKQQVEFIRYTCCLASHDLLVHQADSDLDRDQKARALEKYRTALVEMEKVGSVSEAEADIHRLQLTIDSIEQSLFI